MKSLREWRYRVAPAIRRRVVRPFADARRAAELLGRAFGRHAVDDAAEVRDEDTARAHATDR